MRWIKYLLFVVVMSGALGNAGYKESRAAPFSALAIDARTGKVIHAKDADGLRHPASLTKVMTLYILFEELQAGRLTPNSSISISRYAASMAPTRLGVPAGQSINVDLAIKSLIIRSANDVAVAVAEKISGNEAAFALRMTRTARALGMSRTTFYNASGLPNARQWTTARDMAILSLRIQRDFPRHYPFFRITNFSYKGRLITTHNRVLKRFKGADGIKTGYIDASGFNLTTSAVRGQKRIVGVVMGGHTATARDLYMIQMLERAFPSCIDGKTITSRPGAIQGSAPATEIPYEATQSVQTSEIQKELPSKNSPTLEKSTEIQAQSTQPDKLPFAMSSTPVSLEKPISISSTGTGWLIQVGAFPSHQAAQIGLEKTRATGLNIVKDKPALTEMITKGKAKIYRARFSGFSREAAHRACQQLDNKGIHCLALSPPS